ncbi:putative peptidoglycan lipid II flippase [Kineococcus radiotolerans]|uniref:Putative peptidoglycan lipid II flippase n=1 Tax=Kineococcus radiotolerans TaxID=131568 RepID=A0A7W4XYX4_KINRA|nr:lipid II flippase MurJ [Kineococcus radiotolerans]MBB2902719.1 putative peptidoglycan lipid II flippase [Kineococcus radiotolerans]
MTPRVRSVAAAAASVALLTVLARLAGFGRILAFSQTVGDTCLGTAYTTANLVPNVLFEVVAGGALAGVLVPLLSSRLASGDERLRADASRTASAALTWSVLVLVVVAGLTALLARPVMGLLLRGGSEQGCGDSLLRTGTVMLWVFLPQVPLYAVAVVFAGVLQAQQRFTAPAAAPLVSSLVVGGTYLVVGGIVPAAVVRGDLADVPARAVAVLAGGTTLGVLVLALAHAPALRSAVRWRPTWRPAPGDGRRLRSLALSGLAVLLAQQVVTVAVAVAANQVSPGAVNRWSYAWAMFLLPYAVLAVPVATAVFPRLARAADGSREEFAALLAPAVRTVLLVSSLGAGVLAAVASPVAVVFVVSRVGSGRSGDLAASLVLFAPALLGYGLVALLTRALYSLGEGRAAAAGTVLGWAVVLLGVAVLPPLLPADRVVSALALAHTLGLSVAGVLLLRAVHRAAGPGSLAGLARVVVAAVLAALAGGVAGGLLGARLRVGSTAGEVALGVAAAVLAALAWAVVARLGAPTDVRVLTGTLRRVVRR